MGQHRLLTSKGSHAGVAWLTVSTLWFCSEKNSIRYLPGLAPHHGPCDLFGLLCQCAVVLDRQTRSVSGTVKRWTFDQCVQTLLVLVSWKTILRAEILSQFGFVWTRIQWLSFCRTASFEIYRNISRTSYMFLLSFLHPLFLRWFCLTSKLRNSKWLQSKSSFLSDQVFAEQSHQVPQHQPKEIEWCIKPCDDPLGSSCQWRNLPTRAFWCEQAWGHPKLKQHLQPFTTGVPCEARKGSFRSSVDFCVGDCSQWEGLVTSRWAEATDWKIWAVPRQLQQLLGMLFNAIAFEFVRNFWQQ